MKIYPDISIEESTGAVRIETFLRKQSSNGKWFLQRFSSTHGWDPTLPNIELIRGQFIQKFHKEIYYSLILGKVSEYLKDTFGMLVFELDTSQISEEERIKKLIGYL